jgi:hypothetical protein
LFSDRLVSNATAEEKAENCKTVYTSSILVVASIPNLFKSFRISSCPAVRPNAGATSCIHRAYGRGSARLGKRYMETRRQPQMNQPPVAITNPLAISVTAAKNRAISEGVSVQSLRMLRLACWTIQSTSVSSNVKRRLKFVFSSE